MEENFAAAESEALSPEAVAEISGTAEEVVPPRKKRRHINRAKLQDNIWGWVFCIPLIIGTVWFIYAALVMALLLSFTNFSVGVGSSTLMDYLGHFSQNIYHRTDTIMDPVTGDILEEVNQLDPFFWYKNIFTKTSTMDATTHEINQMGAYLFNTVFYMIGIPIGMVLSMFFAVCMSRDIKGGNLFRVLYYIPCVASSISIVYTFKIMFDAHGVINSLFGIDGTTWLTGKATWNSITGANSSSQFMSTSFWCQGIIAKSAIVIMSVWKGLGGTIILYVAGLSGVNGATKEAAQIDGANGWQIFWKVTMPDLYPVIFYNIVTSVIGGMQIYAEPVLFNPDSAVSGDLSNTSGYVSLIWKYGLTVEGSGGKKASAGAAYGMFLAVIIFVLTLFQFWLDSRKKD